MEIKVYVHLGFKIGLQLRAQAWQAILENSDFNDHKLSRFEPDIMV